AALASGLSLPVAFAEVAPTLPAGLAVPTRRAAAALALGAPVGEALAAYTGAVPDEDVAPLAVVLAAFARSGGRVGRSLARVAALVGRAPGFGRLSDARRLLADLALGRSLPDALRGFGRGGDDARVAALVVAATRFGAPLAELLVIQADALRTTERRRAEAEARRLPVLMLFPLSLTILPALLLVFLGPPLLSLLSP